MSVLHDSQSDPEQQSIDDLVQYEIRSGRLKTPLWRFYSIDDSDADVTTANLMHPEADSASVDNISTFADDGQLRRCTYRIGFLRPFYFVLAVRFGR
jgi:hypothetical protein